MHYLLPEPEPPEEPELPEVPPLPEVPEPVPPDEPPMLPEEPEEPIDPDELDPEDPLVAPVSAPRRSHPTAVRLRAASTNNIFEVFLIAFIFVPFVNGECDIHMINLLLDRFARNKFVPVAQRRRRSKGRFHAIAPASEKW